MVRSSSIFEEDLVPLEKRAIRDYIYECVLKNKPPEDEKYLNIFNEAKNYYNNLLIYLYLSNSLITFPTAFIMCSLYFIEKRPIFLVFIIIYIFLVSMFCLLRLWLTNEKLKTYLYQL